jgi:hypothetical protein
MPGLCCAIYIKLQRLISNSDQVRLPCGCCMQVTTDADKNPPPPGMLKALPRCSNSSDLLVGQKVRDSCSTTLEQRCEPGMQDVWGKVTNSLDLVVE